MKITVIGTGYVGLVTGVCFSEMGHQVLCLDIDQEKINQLLQGKVPIYEPGLQELIHRNIKEDRLHFTTSYEESISFAEAIFLAVSTPANKDGSCNTSFVLDAAKKIGSLLTKPVVIVNKSTAAVGTCFEIEKTIQKELEKRDLSLSFEIVSNPEFLKEGSAIADCMKPDRVVIGCNTEKSKQFMQKIYAPFMFNHERILFMDILSAEMTKYAANAMLATRISFMNEIAKICEKVGADANKVRKGIGSDPRIGPKFLYPGIGYGGSCFPKDVKALISLAKENGVTPYLLEQVENINNQQKERLAKEIIDYFAKKNEPIKGKIIAVWGLSFKPDTDDVREAPSLTFIQQMQQMGAHLRLYDPVAMNNTKKIFADASNITWCKNEKEAAINADAIALLTEWKQFRVLDFSPIKSVMKRAVFFDGRNQYQSKDMQEYGFDYFGIGIPKKDNSFD